MAADRNGVVTEIKRFDAVLSNSYNLRKFPFDSQTLHLEIQPFLSAATEMQFALEALPSTGISHEQYTELASWDVRRIEYTVKRASRGSFLPQAKEAIFRIAIKRRSGFYVWKVFLPLLVMSMIPASVFWIDPKEFDWLLKLPLTTLLSLVAFEFAISHDLPKTPYVTFLDAVMLTSFIFFFLSMLEITVGYIMQTHWRRPLALKMHAAARWVYPVAYFGVLLGLSVIFFA